ncbi:hypothetical protein [uncultured Phyllobacterium sp.]|uniref:hypothetical protein n=1 Tax=uncultured Phyllobacterium sp. TaxID=253813 RepID=UPI00258D9180|nr:hypothetical protein [uncultured Phyllobacterium sp.]
MRIENVVRTTQSMSAFRTIVLLSIAFAAISLSVATVGFVIWNHMAIPLYDDVFDQGRFHAASAEGWKPLFKYLISQHNEHRIFTTRLLMIADTWLFQGREYIQIAVSMALHCLIAVLIFRFVFLRKRATITVAEGLLFFATFLLLSVNPNYLYTFLVAFQVQHTIIALLCVLAALLVGGASDDERGPSLTNVRFFMLLLGYAFIATLTLGNSPVVLLGVAACSIVLRWRLSTTVALLLMGIAHAALVLATTNSVGTTSRDPIAIIHFLAFYLGAPLLRFAAWPGSIDAFWTSTALATAIGCFILLIAIVYSIARFLYPRLGGAAGAAGLALMSFVVTTGLAAAYSRAQFGIIEAGNKKYSSFASLGLIAALIIITSVVRERRAVRDERTLQPVYVVLLLLLIPMSYAGYIRETEIWQKASERSWEAAAAVVMNINSQSVMGGVSSPAADIVNYTKFAEPKGLGPFNLIGYRWGQDFSSVMQHMTQTQCRGSFESIHAIPADDKQEIFKIGGSPAIIGGWSWISASKSPASTVVAVDRDNRIVGVAKSTRTSQAAEEWLGQKFYNRMGWYGFVRAEDLVAIKLVALDDSKGLFCDLGPVGSTQ